MTRVVTDVRFRGATSRVELRIARRDAEPVPLVWHTAQPPLAGRRIRIALDRAHVSELCRRRSYW